MWTNLVVAIRASSHSLSLASRQGSAARASPRPDSLLVSGEKLSPSAVSRKSKHELALRSQPQRSDYSVLQSKSCVMAWLHTTESREDRVAIQVLIRT